jgi:hypothetical protein
MHMWINKQQKRKLSIKNDIAVHNCSCRKNDKTQNLRRVSHTCNFNAINLNLIIILISV